MGCTLYCHRLALYLVAPCFEKGRRRLPAVGERKGHFAPPCKVTGHPLFNIHSAFWQGERGLRVRHQGQQQAEKGCNKMF